MRSDGIQIDLEEERKDIAALPVVRVGVTRVAARRVPRDDSTAADSTAVETAVSKREVAFARALEEFHYLPRGLRRLGYKQKEAEKLVTDAIRVLVDEGAELSDQEIVQQALHPSARKPQCPVSRVRKDKSEPNF